MAERTVYQQLAASIGAEDSPTIPKIFQMLLDENEAKVLFAAYMPGHGRGEPSVMEMEEGATVRTLIERLHLPEDRPKMIFLNGRRVKENALLSEADRAGIFPLVAGG